LSFGIPSCIVPSLCSNYLLGCFFGLMSLGVGIYVVSWDYCTVTLFCRRCCEFWCGHLGCNQGCHEFCCLGCHQLLSELQSILSSKLSSVLLALSLVSGMYQLDLGCFLELLSLGVAIWVVIYIVIWILILVVMWCCPLLRSPCTAMCWQYD
jgi:hypothetical protein